MSFSLYTLTGMFMSSIFWGCFLHYVIVPAFKEDEDNGYNPNSPLSVTTQLILAIDDVEDALRVLLGVIIILVVSCLIWPVTAMLFLTAMTPSVLTRLNLRYELRLIKKSINEIEEGS